MVRLTKLQTACLAAILAAISNLLYFSLIVTNNNITLPSRHTIIDMPLQNITISNEFISTFIQILRHPVFDIQNAVPLILKNNKLYCRSIHHTQILKHTRLVPFIEMISRGLKLNYYHPFTSGYYEEAGLPIVLLNGDMTGCNASSHTDIFPFPRLSWSIPSSKHQQHYNNNHTGEEEVEWCHTIGMVSYETWNAFHKRHHNHHSWDTTFAKDETRHPWHTKLPKAIWRGTTTHEQTITKEYDFEDIPRAKLVQSGIENSDVIDAAFTAIIQKFEMDKEVLAKKTRVGDYMPFVKQLDYKAFIDIDGNNWSSRFIMLLCTNSVVIKIEPDWIEYFYDDLIPNIHYIPASLENISNVVRYVVDPANDQEMRNVVKSANSWCKRTVTEEVLIRDEMYQLEAYEAALVAYGDRTSSWIDEWTEIMTAGIVDDLVECISSV